MPDRESVGQSKEVIMKKLISTLIFTAVILCLAVGITACGGDPETVRVLTITGADGFDYETYNLGDFYYKKSAEESGDYPDLSSLKFKVQYDDGSISPLASDTPELKLAEIKKDGVTVADTPVLYDVGTWEYVYEYKGAKASVYFSILPAMNAEYEITGLPSSWIYSAIPDLTEIIAVSGYADPLVYFGDDTNAYIYYIPVDVYDENFSDAVMDADTLFNLEFASSIYYPYEPDGSPYKVYVNAGEYYFYLKLSASGNYDAQITKMQKVTVQKEILEIGSLPTLEVSYEFDIFDGPGNAKVSKIYRPDYSFTTTNKGGETVKLSTSDWMNPDDEVSAATPDKKYKVKLSPDTSFDNYNTDNLYIECTVAVTKGLVGWEQYTFKFDGEDQLVVNRDVELNDCTQNGLQFFNSNSYSNDEYLLSEFFGIVKVTDGNGKKLPVYAENSDTPLYDGDEGASAKVVRTLKGTSYDYYIILNEIAVGNYTFTVSLIDDVNFRWGTTQNDYGNAPIILNYSVVENDPNGYMNVVTNYVTDGTITIDLYVDEAAYDPALLDTFTITREESHTIDENVIYSDENVSIDPENVQVSETGRSGSQVILTATLPVTMPDDTDFHYLCLSITMQTAETYADVNVSAYAYLKLS